MLGQGLPVQVATRLQGQAGTGGNGGLLRPVARLGVGGHEVQRRLQRPRRVDAVDGRADRRGRGDLRPSKPCRVSWVTRQEA